MIYNPMISDIDEVVQAIREEGEKDRKLLKEMFDQFF